MFFNYTKLAESLEYFWEYGGLGVWLNDLISSSELSHLKVIALYTYIKYVISLTPSRNVMHLERKPIDRPQIT